MARHLPCAHPDAEGCRGSLILRAHRWEQTATSYTLSCDHCGRRTAELAGHPLERYLAHISTSPAADEYAALQGYLPADYLTWSGLSPECLRRAESRSGLYAWVIE